VKVQICRHVDQFIDAKLFSCTDQLEQVLDEQWMRVIEAVRMKRENQRKTHDLITLALLNSEFKMCQLEARGLRVLRFPNEMVLEELPEVIRKIRKMIRA
jgi:hypothetical protein